MPPYPRAESEDALLLTVAQAARKLGIGERTIWRLLQRGELPATRVGRIVRIPVRELEVWIASRTEGAIRVQNNGEANPR